MPPQEPPAKRLGTTSYAVLGLLALRDWTTYELAQQMERGIGRMWAASPSMIYEEPKHLVARGLATAEESPVGRRPRSRYSITAAGREALANWLAEEPAPPALQFEGLLKVLFADHGHPDANTVAADAIGTWATEAQAAASTRSRGYLAGDYIPGVDFDARVHVVAQTLGFLADFYDLVERWATWAAGIADRADPDEARATFARIASGRRAIQPRARQQQHT